MPQWEIVTERNILQVIREHDRFIKSLQRREVRPDSIDQFTNVLGLFRAPQFMFGDGDPFDSVAANPFTGIYIGVPGVIAGSDEYYLYTAENGVMNVAITKAGKFIGGSGNVVIDDIGIIIANSVTSSLRFKAADGTSLNSVIGLDPFNDLEIVNLLRGTNNGTISFFLKDTAGTTRRPLLLKEDTGAANVMRAEFGIDHFIPSLDAAGSGSTSVWFNERLKNIDFRYKGQTDDKLFFGDASLDGVGFGGDAQSGYKVKITGNQNVTGNILVSGKATLDGQASLGEKNTAIGDDAVYSFTPPATLGICFVAPTAPAINTRWGIFSYRAVATTFCLAMVTGAASIVGTTGVLTGTTGTDGNITVSTHTDGKIYIENRSGASRNFNIAVF